MRKFTKIFKNKKSQLFIIIVLILSLIGFCTYKVSESNFNNSKSITKHTSEKKPNPNPLFPSNNNGGGGNPGGDKPGGNPNVDPVNPTNKSNFLISKSISDINTVADYHNDFPSTNLFDYPTLDKNIADFQANTIDQYKDKIFGIEILKRENPNESGLLTNLYAESSFPDENNKYDQILGDSIGYKKPTIFNNPVVMSFFTDSQFTIVFQNPSDSSQFHKVYIRGLFLTFDAKNKMYHLILRTDGLAAWQNDFDFGNTIDGKTLSNDNGGICKVNLKGNLGVCQRGWLKANSNQDIRNMFYSFLNPVYDDITHRKFSTQKYYSNAVDNNPYSIPAEIEYCFDDMTINGMNPYADHYSWIPLKHTSDGLKDFRSDAESFNYIHSDGIDGRPKGLTYYQNTFGKDIQNVKDKINDIFSDNPKIDYSQSTILKWVSTFFPYFRGDIPKFVGSAVFSSTYFEVVPLIQNLLTNFNNFISGHSNNDLGSLTYQLYSGFMLQGDGTAITTIENYVKTAITSFENAIVQSYGDYVYYEATFSSAQPSFWPIVYDTFISHILCGIVDSFPIIVNSFTSLVDYLFNDADAKAKTLIIENKMWLPSVINNDFLHLLIGDRNHQTGFNSIAINFRYFIKQVLLNTQSAFSYVQ